MNDKKFCFIICTNCDYKLDECFYYIERLIIPEGYEREVLTVHDAVSMTSGYQEAMESTDAKYKVYMHQDVFILNSHFMEDVLSIFEKDPVVGMIGMVGSMYMAHDGIMWSSRQMGALYLADTEDADYTVYRYDREQDGAMEVECADGLLLATQVDIPWRTDLFDGWDFYDASQCMEMRRAGYHVVVPYQRSPWCLHDDGLILSMWNYDKYRHRFLEEYGKDLAINKEQAAWGERRLDERKLAFVIAYSDIDACTECARYLERLQVPVGYTTELICIPETKGIAAAYNEAIRRTNARYKVYVRQETFVLEKNVLSRLLEVFAGNTYLGMVGLVGGFRLYGNFAEENNRNCGNFFSCDSCSVILYTGAKSKEENYMRPDAVEGMLMMTNRDIPWREDLFTEDGLYDISQSFEFRRRGYKIAIPNQEAPWCLSDHIHLRQDKYERNRKILKEEYPDLLGFSLFKENEHPDAGLYVQAEGMMDNLIALLEKGLWTEALTAFKETERKFPEVKRTGVIKQLLEICEAEMSYGITASFCRQGTTFEQMSSRYTKIKYLLRRLENELPGAYEELLELLKKEPFSPHVYMVISEHNVWNDGKIKEALVRGFREAGRTEDAGLVDAWTV